MVVASRFLGAGIQHRERKESECSRRVGQRNQILHTQTQQRKYQWDICMHRYSVVGPPSTVAMQRTSRPPDNELYLVIGAFTAHHVLPAAIRIPRITGRRPTIHVVSSPVIDQDLDSAAANNKIKQSVLSKHIYQLQEIVCAMRGLITLCLCGSVPAE